MKKLFIVLSIILIGVTSFLLFNNYHKSNKVENNTIPEITIPESSYIKTDDVDNYYFIITNSNAWEDYQNSEYSLEFDEFDWRQNKNSLYIGEAMIEDKEVVVSIHCYNEEDIRYTITIYVVDINTREDIATFN